jgi:hypothetical protein
VERPEDQAASRAAAEAAKAAGESKVGDGAEADLFGGETAPEAQPAADGAEASVAAADRALEVEEARFQGGPDFHTEGADPRSAYARAMQTVPEAIRAEYLVHGISSTRGGTRGDALAGILRDRPETLNAGPVLPSDDEAATGLLATRVDARYLLVFDRKKPMGGGPAMVVVNSPSADIVAGIRRAFPQERVVSPDEAARIMRGGSGPEPAAAGLRPALAPEAERFTAEGPDGLLRLANGRTDLGHIPDGLAVPAGPIELPRGWHDEAGDRGGGLIHIEARHGAEIRAAGWDDPAQFVAAVAANFTEVRRQVNGTLLLVQRDVARAGQRDPQASLVVGLSRTNEGGYRVITAGRFKNAYIGKTELLWQAEHPAAPRPNGPAAPSSSPPQEASASAGSLSARDQSAQTIGTEVPPGKATFSPELQEAQRLASEATAAVRAEIDAGRISEADAAPLFAAETAAKIAEGNARAYQAAAACLIAGGLGL